MLFVVLQVIFLNDNTFGLTFPVLLIYPSPARAAGVVVSCEIAILATRVRFPGGAHFIISLNYEAEY